MMDTARIDLAWKLGVLLFAVASAWFQLRQVRKDLNGLGNKVRNDRSAEDFRFWTVAMLLVASTSDRDARHWLADRILEAAKRRL